MSHSNTIFHQLLKFLPHSCFQKTVDRYNGDYRRRTLSCWDQLLAMLFCQLSGRQSLRDIVEGFNSQHRHLYHLGSRKVHRSTLADANNKTPTGIFKEARETDSPQVISDEVISFCAPKAQKDCPIPLRRIVFLREEDKKTLVFISNDFGRSAQEMADLYKQRWQIELFFKWIKQNLKIKRFVGRSENAVMIQVLVALISYVLLKLAQTSYPSSFSLQQIARLMAVNLMNRKTMEELLKPDRGKENDDEKTCPQMEIKLGYF